MLRQLPRALALAALAVLALPISAQAAGFGSRDLLRGDRGPDVRTMQRLLNRVGIRTAIDGAFGRGTERNVRRFERRAHLRADGVLRRAEARALRRWVWRVGRGVTDPTVAEPQAIDQTTTDGGASLADPGTPTTPPPVGRATVNPDGTATPPIGAPTEVIDLIDAGNSIAHKPYVYGGGHGSFTARGYDCSGSVSFALHGAGLLSVPRNSTGFESWGRPGRGRWISVYANAGHAYLTVAGLRFDTSGRGRDGTRWHRDQRSPAGYVVRHPRGL